MRAAGVARFWVFENHQCPLFSQLLGIDILIRKWMAIVREVV